MLHAALYLVILSINLTQKFDFLSYLRTDKNISIPILIVSQQGYDQSLPTFGIQFK